MNPGSLSRSKTLNPFALLPAMWKLSSTTFCQISLRYKISSGCLNTQTGDI